MNLSTLEVKKILIDIKYWKDDFSIKKEMINNIDIEFNKEVENYLNTHLEIKEKWNNHLDGINKNVSEMVDKTNNNIKENIPEDDSDSDNDDSKSTINLDDLVSKKPKDPFLKSLYREIVKKTHPDKIKKKHFTTEQYEDRMEMYKTSTTSYDNNNISELLYIADKLNIQFEIKEDYIIEDMRSDLNGLKNRSEFLEKTYTWKWYHSNKEDKNTLIGLYIEHELN